MKRIEIVYAFLALLVVMACVWVGLFSYLYINQPIYSLPPVEVTEGSEMYALLETLGPTEEVTYEILIKRGKITLFFNDVRCCRMMYTPNNMSNLVGIAGNVALSMNAELYQNRLLNTIERLPFVKEGLYKLTGTIIYHFPLGFRLSFIHKNPITIRQNGR